MLILVVGFIVTDNWIYLQLVVISYEYLSIAINLKNCKDRVLVEE